MSPSSSPFPSPSLSPRFSSLLAVGLVLLLTGCSGNVRTLGAATGGTGAQANALRGGEDPFANLPAPKDNPVTQAKVELGFRLWFEPRLSGNNKMTCATCHNHTMAFSNAERVATGISGARGTRNVPTIYGSATSNLQFWDGRADSLEAQALGPIENPIEMDAKLPDVIRKLEGVPYYPKKFKEAFGTGVDAAGIAKAIASFERALTVKQSPYERYWAGDQSALTEQQLVGMKIFNSPKGRCVACHSGPDLTDRGFHNLGVGLTANGFSDLGRYAVTQRDEDLGRFKTPTLRNVAGSAPYMHDGSLATLQDVVAFYNRGGEDNPNQDPRIGPLNLTADEQAALVAFLRALSAPDNLRDLGKLPGITAANEPAGSLKLPKELVP